MSTAYLFDKESPAQHALDVWWRELNDNRGERAVLRRCRTLAEVFFSPAYHRLYLALSRIGDVYVDREGLALVAGLATHVKIDGKEGTIAEQMATGKPDGSARVSGLRFRRLLKVKEKEELFSSMIRVIALLDGNVNIQSLARSVYFWNDITRKKWAFEYYSKAANEA